MDQALYLPRVTQRYRRSSGPEEWGTPMPLLNRSITEIREAEFIAHVLNDTHYRRTLLNIKGMYAEGARILDQVDLRLFAPKARGDIDILVIPAGQPEMSTAIQVKRFGMSVEFDAAGNDVVVGGDLRRLQTLMEKGVRQANLTKRLGFAHVYLWAFIAVDGRARNNGWYSYDCGEHLWRGRVDNALSEVGLEPTVGRMSFEWTQPMDRPPFELATHGGSLVSLAATTSQPTILTERLRTLPSPVLRIA
jgi:hypothetical protein